MQMAAYSGSSTAMAMPSDPLETAEAATYAIAGYLARTIGVPMTGDTRSARRTRYHVNSAKPTVEITASRRVAPGPAAMMPMATAAEPRMSVSQGAVALSCTRT